ncbi:MAG: hypothetical protein DI528_00690 [Shinella sp.]|nr:MAG: hypothetical protein DI528_00690 [Shinella sp.]
MFFLGLVSAGFVLMFLDGLDGRFGRIDVDDALRRIEILQLLADARWFDRNLDVIRMPEPYVSPWSRLIDLPYVLLTWVIEPFSGREVAAKYAFLVWPPVMFIGFSLLFTASLFRLLPGASDRVPFWQLVAMVMIGAPAVSEFVPGRIDHHNVQILLLLVFVHGALRADLAGGVLAGVAISVSPMIGLECLPLVAVGAAAVVLAWCIRGAEMRGFALAFLLSCALTTPLLGSLLVGTGGILSTQCDSFSAPFAFVLTVAPLGATVVVLLVPSKAGQGMRLLAMVGVGVTVAICAPVLFSQCLAGPYSIIDPVSQRYWFSTLAQEGGIGAILAAGHGVEVLRLALLALVIMLAGLGFVLEGGAHLGRRAIAWGVAASVLPLALAMFRYTPIATSLGPLFLPLAVRETVRLWQETRAGRRVLGLAGAGLVGLAAIGAANAMSSAATKLDIVAYMNADSCEGEDLSDMELLSKGRILAPPGVAMAIASRMQPGISVAGIPFHRASPGLRRTYEALASKDTGVRREALAPFDYVAVCRRALPAEGERAPLFRALAGGGGWPGMTVIGTGKSAFRLFRIEHDTLR